MTYKASALDLEGNLWQCSSLLISVPYLRLSFALKNRTALFGESSFASRKCSRLAACLYYYASLSHKLPYLLI